MAAAVSGGASPQGARTPDGGASRLEAVRRLIGEGRRVEARRHIAWLEPDAWADTRSVQALGELHVHCGDFAGAVRCYRRAVELSPDAPRALYDLAAALVALGDLKAAERLFDRVIALDPADADAWVNRSSLRRWTQDDNHVADLTQALRRPVSPSAEVASCYALAKELEDLGRWPESFAALKRGADRRRSLLSYRVEADLEAMAEIARVYDAERLSAAPAASDAPGPIFVLGLPRSGTTLVDRILSAHAQIESLGEISDFALALMQQLGPSKGKADLIRRSAELDFASLGRAYRERLAEYEPRTPFVIDKTPVNYLYVGLIALALPEARIVHVRREPMDNGYALYKTLFRTGCPYSYDLDDLGRYMLAYRALTAHWRAALPGRFVEIDYEALVADQAGESRRLLAGVGLGWQDACLEFHKNPSPAATASAAQVRRPIYSSSVGLWRRYERELEPLRVRLAAGGAIA